MKNLHIVPNYFTHDSRVLKETESLVDANLVKYAHIVSLHAHDLAFNETIDSKRSVHRFPLFCRFLPKVLFFQVFKYIEFSIKCYIFSKKNKINIINIHHVVLLPIGVVLSKLCSAKLIYDTHELETEIHGLNGFRKYCAKFLEHSLIRFPELIIVVSDGIKSWYEDNYNRNNIVTVLNCPKYFNPVRSRVLHHELGLDHSKKILLYQGGLQTGRGIEGLLSIFSKWNDEQYVIVFMGTGPLLDLVRKYSANHASIFLQPAAPPDTVLKYTSSADVGISYIDNSSLNDYFCLPNKFFEYIMAGLPVIVNDVPEMRKIVEKFSIGHVASVLSTEEIKESLHVISKMDKSKFNVDIIKARNTLCWEKQEEVMLQAYNHFEIM